MNQTPMNQNGVWSFSAAKVGNTPNLVLEVRGGVLHSRLGGMRSHEPRMKRLAAAHSSNERVGIPPNLE